MESKNSAVKFVSGQCDYLHYNEPKPDMALYLDTWFNIQWTIATLAALWGYSYIASASETTVAIYAWQLHGSQIWPYIHRIQFSCLGAVVLIYSKWPTKRAKSSQ